ncbi:acyl-CoA N-acyltransferase [Cladochytrium replicatum]|nr:acyl-CoA N-acyltransferase [Cladochytrium replicatum]
MASSNTDAIVAVTRERPTHKDALGLIEDLSNDLAARYREKYPSVTGRTNYVPENEVLKPRSVFVIARIDGRPCGCGALVPFKFLEPKARVVGVSPDGFHLEEMEGERKVEPWEGKVDLLKTPNAEIKRMWVANWARGKGIAKAVCSELENFAKENGYTKVRLETGIMQPEAIGLYRRLGYLPFPKYGEYVVRDYPVCFEKALDHAAEGSVHVLEQLGRSTKLNHEAMVENQDLVKVDDSLETVPSVAGSSHELQDTVYEKVFCRGSINGTERFIQKDDGRVGVPVQAS